MRFWILSLVVAGLMAGMVNNEAEARDRHRNRRVQGTTYRVQSPVRYTASTTQAAPIQSTQQSAQPVIRQAGFENTGGRPNTQGNWLQAWAEEEARLMASRGTCGHVRGAPPGCFVGVGCGMTCMGSGRLVAEASYQGKMVRVWQR